MKQNGTTAPAGIPAATDRHMLEAERIGAMLEKRVASIRAAAPGTSEEEAWETVRAEYVEAVDRRIAFLRDENERLRGEREARQAAAVVAVA